MLRRHFTNVVNSNSNNEEEVDLTLPYITFEALAANSTIGLAKKLTRHTLQYSYDTITWNKMTKSTIITLVNVGDKVYIRGKTGTISFSSSAYTQFTMTGLISARGNCNAIWDYEHLDINKRYTYEGYSMFRDCTSLTTAPALPATTLESDCYRDMFRGCTSLIKAPVLPASPVRSSCYHSMFKGCTNLNYVVCLATLLDGYATADWLYGVSRVGTFIKHPDMTSWSVGEDGIPSGWTIIDTKI